MSTKEEYMQKFKAKLDELNGYYEQAKAKIDDHNVGEVETDDYRQDLENIDQQRADIDAKLAEIKESTEEGWAHVKSNADDLWSAATNKFDELKNKYIG